MSAFPGSALEPAQAYAALEEFAVRNGRLPLLLLAHVAVPQSFRADLVNLLKVNFLPEAGDDLSIDADVLFSTLAEGYGGGYFRLDREIRHQCLIFLDSVYCHGSERRRVSVARFLLAYMNDLARSPQSADDARLADYIEIERQLAAAIVNPSAAAERFARALKSRTSGLTATRVHFTEMASVLSVSLAGYPELLAYARGIGALQSGRRDEASRVFAKLGGGEIKVGDISLLPGTEILRDIKRLESTPAPPPVDVPGPPLTEDTKPSAQPRDIDIFVSYARIDDEPIFPAKQGWVSTLRDNLERDLARMMDRRISWRFESGQSWSLESGVDQSNNAVSKAKLFLAVLSPSFLASEFCQRELAEFIDSYHGQAGDHLFIAEREPPDSRHVMPEALRRQRKFKFYKLDTKNVFRTFASPEPRPDERDYFAAVNDLSRDIAGALRSIERKPEMSPAVFLAVVTDDLELRRDELRRYLDQAGIDVLPKRTYPLVGPEFEQSMIEDLAHSAIFVQLLGPRAGKRPPDVPDGFVWLQHRRAEVLDKMILQWRSPELNVSKVESQSYRRLLELDTVQAIAFADFKRNVIDAYRQVVPPSVPAQLPGPHDRFVFIVADRVDLEIADEIKRQLGDRLSWSMPLSLYDTDAKPEELQRDFEFNLIDCDALIIVYGDVRPSWVISQLQLYRKLAPRRRDPVRLLAIVQARGPKAPLSLGVPGLRMLPLETVGEVVKGALQ